MLDDIISQSRSLPKVENFFPSPTLPENFRVPSSVLLYCHAFNWPETIISSRYMLIIPYVDITYQVEGLQYPLHCGQALLVKPYLHRSIPSLYQDYLRLIISFELNDNQTYVPDQPVMNVTDIAWDLIASLLKNYDRNETIPTAFSLTLLLNELNKNSINTRRHKNSPEIQRTINYINQYIGESFSIEDIADDVQLSPSRLRHRFRLETGISLGKYIRRHRLSSAQHLLVDTDLRIEAVAASCGYDSIFSFSRFFKKNAGISPLHFRKQYQKG
jgi:AraC-like DNA-binding protein